MEKMFNTGGLILVLLDATSESTDALPGVFASIHRHCVYHRWLHINHETITFFSGNKLVCSACYANGQLTQGIQVYYLGQECFTFWIRNKESSGRMDIVSSWVNDCAPFTSLVLEMPNMVCFVRTNSLINLVHIRKFGSCSIASACL